MGIISLILLGIISLSLNSFLHQRNFSFSLQGLKISEKNPPPELFLHSTNFRPESPEFLLVQGNSLLPSSPPVMVTPRVLGQIIGEIRSEKRKEILEYRVEAGDTFQSIADYFEISLETLLWANNLNQNSIITPGQKLLILPVSGVIHRVKSGDTISQIAQIYKGEATEITAFNELSGEGDIFVGDILIIPDGIKPPSPPSRALVPLASSYFICPIPPPCRITQGLHWFNAVDFSHGRCGDPIFAAAGGEVLRVEYGWNSGAGNYVTISHPNGVVTFYGHLATIFVQPGQKVSQGQIIALMGGQPGTPGAGISTGCHLHFGVIGAENPFAR